MMKEVISGIYRIENPKGQIYIGASINIYYRWSQYKKTQNTQHKIAKSIAEFGYENHTFTIVEVCGADLLHERETYHKEAVIATKGWENALFCFLVDSFVEMNKLRRRPVFCYDLDGSFVAEFAGTREAQRITGIISISEAANGKRKTAGNYQWRYDYAVKIQPTKSRTGRKAEIIQMDLNGDLINEFASTMSAAEALNIDNSSIAKAARGVRKSAGGYKWAYKPLKINELCL